MNTRILRALVGTLLLSHGVGAQSAPRQLRLTETLRIDGAKEDLAGDIANLWMGTRGQIAVFDSPNARFVFFDSTGKRLGTFGARGQGPGEFQPAGGNLYSLPNGLVGDTMWVYASNRRRFTLITPDFKLARTLTLPQYDASSILAFTPLALLANDRILGRATFGTRAGAPLPDGRASTTAHYSDSVIIIMAANGSVERRVADILPSASAAVANRQAGQRSYFTVPFLSAPVTAASATGDRVVIVTSVATSPNGGEFRIRVVRTSGEVLFSHTRPYTSATVTRAMADSQLAVRHRQAGQNEAAADELRGLRERIPPALPAFSSGDVGFDGSVWLRRYASSSTPPEFVVFSPSGETLGEVKFSRTGVSLYSATRSSIWVTETDADGFLSIVRFRVDQQ